MSQSDPQSIKISGVTTSLPRVSTGDYKSKYESADGLIDLTFASQNGKRKRHVARVDHAKVTSDPFITTQNVEVSSSISLVIDRPLAGYTNAEVAAIVAGFIERLTAEESKIITKLIAGES